MRRKDREVTDPEKIREVILKCKTLRLGFNDNGEVYIVPLNFGCAEEDDRYTFYFHGAAEGRKADLLKTGPSVGFEMDCGYEIHEADTACHYSAAFASVIGTGRAVIVTDPEEKLKGLKALMKQSTGREDWTFDAEAAARVCVFKLTVEKLSCKIHA